MGNYPPAVGKMVKALNSLQGVSEVDVGLKPIDSITVENLSLPAEFAVLPHLAIKRSNGGKANEALISFEFTLDKDINGWNSLEFISWWVRDMCRSGHEIQLRPQAMPPQVGENTQLGNSLLFLLELFYVEPDDDPMKIADYVGDCADSLTESISLYSEAIKTATPKKGLLR